jgi:nucleotide-binding universal stress UspA family protein
LKEDDVRLSDIKKETELRFETEIKPLLGGLTNVTFHYHPTDPALEVCKIARNIQADLIILGCHQRPEKMCLGRVDYAGITILEKSPCPVMLVPLCE